MSTIHLLIKGRVQGVFFRARTRELAERIGVTGWVKNTAEGNVEAVATGDRDQLEQFINWCRKGPSKAAVTTVSVKQCPDEKFDHFSILK